MRYLSLSLKVSLDLMLSLSIVYLSLCLQVKLSSVSRHAPGNTLLGVPVTEGPIDLYHGLSNYQPSWGTNFDLLTEILSRGFLFPKGDNSRTLEQAIYQFEVERINRETTVHASVDYVLEHEDRFRRVVGSDAELGIPKPVNIMRTEIMRKGTNFFFSGDAALDSKYAEFLTLHFHFETKDLEALKEHTAGDFVVFQRGSDWLVPQSIGLEYLTSVVVNDAKLSAEQLESIKKHVHDLLDSHGHSHVQVLTISGLRERKLAQLRAAASSVERRPLPEKLKNFTVEEVIGMKLMASSGDYYTSTEYPGYLFHVTRRFDETDGEFYFDVEVAE
jgi:hypothetical protein